MRSERSAGRHADRARPAASRGRTRPPIATSIFRGTNQAVTELRDGADPNGRVRRRALPGSPGGAAGHRRSLGADVRSRCSARVLAALDTAAFRVDPWLTGIAERRLQQMIADGRAVPLGAYGWVDAPAPYTGAAGGPLAPGPDRAPACCTRRRPRRR